MLKVPNEYEVRGNVAALRISGSKLALVDAADLGLVLKYRWSLKRMAGPHRYVRSNSFGEQVLLHRLLLGVPDGVHVDHVNGDGLDNRRCNIRPCTQQQNLWNTRPKPRSRVPFKGVTQADGRFRARICHEQIGCYSTAEDAARAYDAAAMARYGEFAYLNFPKDFSHPPEVR